METNNLKVPLADAATTRKKSPDYLSKDSLNKRRNSD